jgi:hypothetical protein
MLIKQMSDFFIINTKGHISPDNTHNHAAEEGLYTDGGDFLLADGTEFKGYYHLHTNGSYLAGYTSNECDIDSITNYPSPQEPIWHEVLTSISAASAEDTFFIEPSSVLSFLGIDQKIINSGIPQIMRSVKAEKEYLITTAPLREGDIVYKNVLVPYYVYINDNYSFTSIGNDFISNEAEEELDTEIVNFIQQNYLGYLSRHGHKIINSNSNAASILSMLSSEYSVVPPTFKNPLLYQSGDVYEAYDVEDIMITKAPNSIKAKIKFNESFANSANPLIACELLTTKDEKKKYFSNIKSFEESFVATDLYGAVELAKNGLEVPTTQVFTKQIDEGSTDLFFDDINYGDEEIGLLISLVSDENVFTFYLALYVPFTYNHPTIDLVTTREVPFSTPIKKCSYENSNFSKLYCSYTPESAHLFFCFNIGNYIKDIITFPGAFSMSLLDKFTAEPYLLQKRISINNNQMKSIGISTSYYDESKKIPLVSKLLSYSDNGVVHYFGTTSLERYEKYNYDFNMMIRDFSLDIAKRKIRHMTSMIGILEDVFVKETNKSMELGTLTCLIDEMRIFYDNIWPTGVEYLDKVGEYNFVLSAESAVIIIDFFRDMIYDIRTTMLSADIKKSTVTNWAMPPVTNVVSLKHEFQKTVEKKPEKTHTYENTFTHDNPLPTLSLAEIADSSFSDVYKEENIQCTIMNEIPESFLATHKAFEKQYLYYDLSNLQKYAPNYELGACDRELGMPLSPQPPVQNIKYAQKAENISLQVAVNYERFNVDCDYGNKNDIVVSAPKFINLSDTYEEGAENASMAPGTYLAKLDIEDVYYNQYFLLEV